MTSLFRVWDILIIFYWDFDVASILNVIFFIFIQYFNSGIRIFLNLAFFLSSEPYLQDGKFPQSVRSMTGIQWLKLDGTNISEIPKEMGKLLKLVSQIKQSLLFHNVSPNSWFF